MKKEYNYLDITIKHPIINYYNKNWETLEYDSEWWYNLEENYPDIMPIIEKLRKPRITDKFLSLED